MSQSPGVAVIGAGPSGLTAARNCLEAGLAVTVFEQNDRVGGNWVFNSRTGHASVYENTHIIYGLPRPKRLMRASILVSRLPVKRGVTSILWDRRAAGGRKAPDPTLKSGFVTYFR